MKKLLVGLVALTSISSFASSALQNMYDEADLVKTLKELATYTVYVSTGSGEDVEQRGGTWRCNGIRNNIELYYGISGNKTQGEAFGEYFTFSQVGNGVRAYENSGYDSRVITFKRSAGQMIVRVSSGTYSSYHACLPLTREY